MSSNPPLAETGRAQLRSPRTWSLRARLLATLITLLAVVCAAVGVGTELALERFLTHQLDNQLHETARRSAGMFEFGPPPPPPRRPRPTA
jgi:two-component system OmpR family sensor kinase